MTQISENTYALNSVRHNLLNSARFGVSCQFAEFKVVPILLPPFQTPRRIEKQSLQQWCWLPHYAHISEDQNQQHGDSGKVGCASGDSYTSYD